MLVAFAAVHVEVQVVGRRDRLNWSFHSKDLTSNHLRFEGSVLNNREFLSLKLLITWITELVLAV